MKTFWRRVRRGGKQKQAVPPVYSASSHNDENMLNNTDTSQTNHGEFDDTEELPKYLEAMQNDLSAISQKVVELSKLQQQYLGKSDTYLGESDIDLDRKLQTILKWQERDLANGKDSKNVRSKGKSRSDSPGGVDIDESGIMDREKLHTKDIDPEGFCNNDDLAVAFLDCAQTMYRAGRQFIDQKTGPPSQDGIRKAFVLAIAKSQDSEFRTQLIDRLLGQNFYQPTTASKTPPQANKLLEENKSEIVCNNETKLLPKILLERETVSRWQNLSMENSTGSLHHVPHLYTETMAVPDAYQFLPKKQYPSSLCNEAEVSASTQSTNIACEHDKSEPSGPAEIDTKSPTHISPLFYPATKPCSPRCTPEDSNGVEFSIDDEIDKEEEGAEKLKAAHLLLLILALADPSFEDPSWDEDYSSICDGESLSDSSDGSEGSGSSASHSSSSTNTSTSSQCSSTWPARSCPSSGGTKRRRTDDEGDDDESNKPPSKKLLVQRIEYSQRQLTCPFAKANPGEHQSCQLIHRKNLSGIKEHVKRNHFNGVLPAIIHQARTWDDVFLCCIRICNFTWKGPVPSPYFEVASQLHRIRDHQSQILETRSLSPSDSSLPSDTSSEIASGFRQILPRPPRNSYHKPSVIDGGYESSSLDLQQNDVLTASKTPASSIYKSLVEEVTISQRMLDIATHDSFKDLFDGLVAPEFSTITLDALEQTGLEQLGQYMDSNFDIDINQPLSTVLGPESQLLPVLDEYLIDYGEDDHSLGEVTDETSLGESDTENIETFFQIASYLQGISPIPVSESTSSSSDTQSPEPINLSQNQYTKPLSSILPNPSKKYTLLLKLRDQMPVQPSTGQSGPKKFHFDDIPEFKSELLSWMIQTFSDPSISRDTCEFENPKNSERIFGIDSLADELEWIWEAFEKDSAAFFYNPKRAADEA